MRPPPLASRDVHVWCVNLDVPGDVSAGFTATLSPEERDRSARLRFDRDRRRFVVAHGALRDVLGSYVGARPDKLRFIHNEFGKPELAPEIGGPLRFNLTHSADLALIAIAAEADVGIDVERVCAECDYSEVARCFFTPAEVDELNGTPRHLHGEGFLGCWTQKEAYLKARGEGFANSPPDAFVPDFDKTWSLFTLQPAPGYIGAVAVEGTGWRLSQHSWKASTSLVRAAS